LIFRDRAGAFAHQRFFAFTCRSPLLGKTFLNFQWDILLLETGFIDLFAPWRFGRRTNLVAGVSPPDTNPDFTRLFVC